MKTKHYSIPIFIMVISLSSGLSAYAADVQWTKTTEANGITSYTRQAADSGIYEIYSTGMVNAPVATVEAVLRDVSARPQYVYGCIETAYADIPGRINTADVHYVYNRTDLPAFLDDRDCIVLSKWTIDTSTGTLYCRSESIRSSYRQSRGVVRMQRVASQYTLIPKGRDRTMVTCQAVGDPGGNIPAFVVNLFTKSLGTNTIEGIRKMSAKAKYQNAGIVTTTSEGQ